MEDKFKIYSMITSLRKERSHELKIIGDKIFMDEEVKTTSTTKERKRSIRRGSRRKF
jgi:hypothetical protein